MKSSSCLRPFSITLFATSLVAVFALQGCSGGPLRDPAPTAPLPAITAARALSRHYVTVRFGSPADVSAVDPSLYRIVSSEGQTLEVVEAKLSEDLSSVVLTTGQQTAVPYRLFPARSEVLGTAQTASFETPVSAVGFLGSESAEPFIESAVGLSSTSILVTFSEEVDATLASVPSFYTIFDADGRADVDIVSAAAAAGSSTVVLTTTTQEDRLYWVRVTNVRSRFRCEFGETTLLDATADGQPELCTEEARSLRTLGGDIAPFTLTARSQITTNQPLNPDAEGIAASVKTSSCGLGVGCPPAFPQIDGSNSAADEEVVFHFANPVRSDRIRLALNDYSFFADDAVLFASSTQSSGYEIVVDEGLIESAYAATNSAHGQILFEAIPGFDGSLLLDRFKIRSTGGSFCLASICLADGVRIDPTRNAVSFWGVAQPDFAPPLLTSAVATSDTTMLLTFSEPLAPETILPQSFTLSPALAVLTADPRAGGTQVLLTTMPQVAGASYQVTVSGVEDLAGNGIDGTNALTLRGGGLPFLRSARALSNGETGAEVLVEFSEAVDSTTATDASSYAIRPYLEVLGATLDPANPKNVVLATPTQSETQYSVTVGTVASADDGALIDPARNVALFTGLALFDDTPPSLASAVSTGETTIIVRFSEPVSDAAANPQFYSFTPDLLVENVVLRSFNTEAVLTTAPQLDGATYTLRVVGVEDPAGNPIEAGFENEAMIQGGGEPYLASVIVLGNTQLLATFSAPLNQASAETEAFYALTPSLAVVSAELQADGVSVLLTTASQEPIDYILAVTQVRTIDPLPNGAFIDPTRNSFEFTGAGPVDDTAPALLSANALSDTQILLSFSEPLADSAANPLLYSIDPSLIIVDAALDNFNTQVRLTTLPQEAGVEYVVTIGPGVVDAAGNPISASSSTETFTFDGQLSVGDSDELPRVVGAVGTSNTGVRVAFSKVMGEGLSDPAHYEISGSDTTYLVVLDVLPSPDRTYVDLVTLSQSPDTYTVHVVNVKDASGHPLAGPSGLLAPPEGPDPARATFRGIPPIIDNENQIDEHTDTDGDGFADWFEQIGWFVTIQFDDGTVSTAHVTSDPYVKDTDGDGIWDGDENRHNFDPRTDDTDADQVSDWDEWNVWYSDPRKQDTDEDGISDLLEIDFFRTSPILADTDGDQMDDGDELFEASRNPLVSDLPIPQIIVDGIRLDVNLVQSWTDEEGVEQTETDSTSVGLAQSRSTSIGRSSTQNVEIANEFSNTFSTSFEIGSGDGGLLSLFGLPTDYTFSVGNETSVSRSRTRGFSTTIDRESAEESQREWQESVERGLARSENRSVTQEVDGAVMQVEVSLRNDSNIAFSLTNVEITARQQDRRSGLGFRPIASLRPVGADDPLSQPTFNLGPLDPERGPIIFESTAVFPKLVDALMREPTGLVFEVVNFDVLDEFGRNFAFSSQEVVERTAGITFDFGDGRVENYRVSTTGPFDEFGRPEGITVGRALEIIGLTQVEPVSTNEFNTFSLIDIEGGRSGVLYRVRNVQTQTTEFIGGRPADPGIRSWVVLPPIGVAEDTPFTDIPLQAGDEVRALYVRDQDADGLWELEEHLYGSDDTLTDSDGDGLTDRHEVRVGWTVQVSGQAPYRVFSDPSRNDSDLDGLNDALEQAMGTDPYRADTDGDGLSDKLEREGPIRIQLLDDDNDPANNPVVVIRPYSTLLIVDGGDDAMGSAVMGDDVVISSETGDFVAILPGPNREIDSATGGDDVLLSSLPQGSSAIGGGLAVLLDGGNGVDESAPLTNPSPARRVNLRSLFRQSQASLRIDEDRDGLVDEDPSDGDDPTDRVDNDGDGAYDEDLDNSGVEFDVDAVVLAVFPANGDFDAFLGGDDYVGVPHRDLFATDPLDPDTDNDGLRDGRETLIGANPNKQDAGDVTDTDEDGLTDSEEAEFGSNPLVGDTDGDGLFDLIESVIESDPLDRDSDDDNLEDGEEFEPLDLYGYYASIGGRETISDALNRCQNAIGCTPPSTQDAVGTNVNDDDSDGDNRGDWEEIFQRFNVVVSGESRERDSDPNKFDTDGDGLNDRVEYLGKDGRAPTDANDSDDALDPRDIDTDDDGSDDEEEFDSCRTVYSGGTQCRSPLIPDTFIEVDLDRLIVGQDCESGTSDLALVAELALDAPSLNEVTILETISGCNQANLPSSFFLIEPVWEINGTPFPLFPQVIGDDETLDLPSVPRVFRLREGQSFTISSPRAWIDIDAECDGTSSLNDVMSVAATGSATIDLELTYESLMYDDAELKYESNPGQTGDGACGIQIDLDVRRLP